MKKHLFYIFGFLVLLIAACNLPRGITPPPPTIEEDRPDFIVEIISIDNTTIVQAQEPWTWVTYRVTNIGTVSYPDDIHMQSVRNGEATSGYVLVEGPFLPGVPVESAVAVGHDTYWDLGDYTFSITVDYDHRVEEENEENNSSNQITFSVVAP